MRLFIQVLRVSGNPPKSKGCVKDKIPDWDKTLGDKSQCEEYWEKAKEFMKKKQWPMVLEFKTAYRILMKGKYCYKPNLFSSKGWCNLAPTEPTEPVTDPQWGFCSTSCDLKFMKVRK